MKKIRVIVAICAIGITCGLTNALASSSGYRTVYVDSLNNVQVASGTKGTSTAKAGAWLSAIGAPDTILFFALDANNNNLTSFSLTESSVAAGVTYNSDDYNSGMSGGAGKVVKVTARAQDFSIGKFPINANADFY